MSQMRLILTCWICFYSWGLIGLSATLDTEKVEHVYENLIQAIGNRIESPSLEIIPASEAESQAQYYPAYHVIAVSDAFLAFAATYGADESTVLALVLGHELAHHYGKHALRSAFATNLNNNGNANLEAEADYFAIFFAYLAGYPTDKIDADFLKDFYQKFEIDALANNHYPSLEKRLLIYQDARKSISDLAKIFQAGNQLLLIDEYTAAAKCFEHIATKFNSPEILNNAGLAYLQAATTLFSETELPFLLPTELEETSNLGITSNLRDGELSEEERILQRKNYIELALANFREALIYKSDYTSSQINLVNALLLQSIDGSNPAFHQLLINQQIELLSFQAQKMPELSYKIDLLKGLNHFLNEEKQAMQAAFETSCSQQPNGIACWNLKKWQNPEAFKNAINIDGGCAEGEAISDRVLMLPSVRNTIDQSQIPPLTIHGYTSQLNIHQRSHEQYTSWRIEWMDHQLETSVFKKIYFLTAAADYSGKNCRDIAIGTKKEVLQKKYGTPFQIKNTRQQQYHRYKNGSVLFGLKEGKVTQIITYYVD